MKTLLPNFGEHQQMGKEALDVPGGDEDEQMLNGQCCLVDPIADLNPLSLPQLNTPCPSLPCSS